MANDERPENSRCNQYRDLLETWAEIEPLARLLARLQYSRFFDDDPAHPGVREGREEFYDQAREVIDLLDRVRDARGDEAPNHRKWLNETADARSPQGEDHEVAREAAFEAYQAHFLYGDHGRSGVDAAIDAYLSRIVPARPEQPPPDRLGGQPPAEPNDEGRH